MKNRIYEIAMKDEIKYKHEIKVQHTSWHNFWVFVVQRGLKHTASVPVAKDGFC